MTVYIGTSGWQYRDWRGRFYPRGLAQARWLEYYAQRFQVVEVNNTFYRLPRAETFAAWHDRTPADFVFGLKMSRYLTHLRRLREPADPVARFFKAAAGLAEKTGPVLVQLPPNMKADPRLLDRALGEFPAGTRVALEFREESWFCDAVRAVLSAHNAALCLADRDEEVITPLWQTADWGYVRLHWGSGGPAPSYTDGAMRAWAGRIAGLWGDGPDVYVFFNNDPGCAAVYDAVRLAREVERSGLSPSRVPPGSEAGFDQG